MKLDSALHSYLLRLNCYNSVSAPWVSSRLLSPFAIADSSETESSSLFIYGCEFQSFQSSGIKTYYLARREAKVEEEKGKGKEEEEDSQKEKDSFIDLF